MKTTKPWTPEQVEALNEFQKNAQFHPFTCGNRDPETHKVYEGYHDYGVLIATEKGWKCPDCDYTQDWAYEFMVRKHV